MLNSVNWLVPGLLLVAAAGFTSLGRWQLDRAEVNRAIEASFVEARELPVLERAPDSADLEAYRYRRIRLDGRYLPETQILLDNMTHEGRAGYAVLTPFETGGGRLVLVNRGFVPAAADRSLVRDVTLTQAASSIRGRIDRLPRAALSLGTPEPVRNGQLVVLSFPDVADIEAVLGRELLPFVILLDPSEPDGYVRDWAPVANRDERNIAYAVQWFGLALLAIAIAIGSVVRDCRRAGGATTA